MSLFDAGPVFGDVWDTLDDGERRDSEGKCWMRGEERLNGPFGPLEVPIYHTRSACSFAKEYGAGRDRFRRYSTESARKYGIPCHRCVNPAAERDDLNSPLDVLDVLGDDAPDPAIRAAERLDGIAERDDETV